MKTWTPIIALLLIFSGCAPKDYIYVYESEEAGDVKVKSTSFNANDFRFNCNVGWDTAIVDKEKTVPMSLTLKVIGQHQFWPKNLKFELYFNDQRVKLTDSVKFNITTVIDDKISNFKCTENEIDIPRLLEKLKKQESIPDSVAYYTLVGTYRKYDVGNKVNPDKFKIMVKAIWDKGSESNEVNYFLKKVEKEEYHMPVRPFG